MHETDPTKIPVVRAARAGDAEKLRPILEHWIRDRDTGKLIVQEVKDVISEIETSIDGQSKKHFVVAEAADGELLGVMGVQPVSERMKRHTTVNSAGELINANVAPEARNLGIGRNLVSQLEDIGRSQGYAEVVVNSGPRYEETGWPFWNAVYGQPIGVAEEFYGVGGDAMVWRKSLELGE